MSPTETLRKEHRNILRMLGCLEIVMLRIRRGEAVGVGDLRDMVRFFQDYADRNHHEKEEAHFFPALVAHGIPSESGPIAVMLQDHGDGRESVDGMSEAVSAEEPSPEDLAAFASEAAQYVPLLRDHIGKEDHVLFRMAEDVLPPEAVSELTDIFEKVDELEIGRERLEELEALVLRLGQKYEIPEQVNADNLPSCAAY